MEIVREETTIKDHKIRLFCCDWMKDVIARGVVVLDRSSGLVSLKLKNDSTIAINRCLDCNSAISIIDKSVATYRDFKKKIEENKT